MQPPPPPLDLPKLRTLVSKADLITVGKIGSVKGTVIPNKSVTKMEITATLHVEKLLKGAISNKSIIIREIYPTPAPMPKKKDALKNTIIGIRVGPACYHGSYEKKNRIIVLLKKINGTDGYKPLGSGTYDKYLCEFFIEDDRIKTCYFKFAEDVLKYAESEQAFIGLIKELRGRDSGKEHE